MSYLEILKASGYDFVQIDNKIAIHNDLGTKQKALSIVKKLAKDVFIAAGITPVFITRYWKGNKMIFTPYRYSSITTDKPHQYPFDLSDNSTCRFYTQPSSKQKE